MSTKFTYPDKETLLNNLSKNPDMFLSKAKDDPAILNWLFNEAKASRRYVKLFPDLEHRLREESRNREIAEGTLIGIGVLLLLWVLAKN